MLVNQNWANADKDETFILGVFAAAASGKAVDKILKEDPNASVEKVIKLALKML